MIATRVLAQPEPSATAELVLELRDVRRQFGTVAAVDGLSLTITPGEVFTLLGPSGCGKTTTLRIVAGLEQPDRGAVYLAGRLMASGEQGFSLAPEKRDLGMVFQSYAIWPHMTVFANVAFPLQLRGVPKRVIGEKVDRVLDLVGMAGFLIMGLAIPEAFGRDGELLLDRLPDLVLVGQELRVALHAQVARARQLDLELDLHPSRAASEDDDPVRKVDRFFDVVRDEERSLTCLRPDLQELELHHFARLRVQRRERLVEKEHLRVGEERPGEVHALLHAPRQLERIGILETLEADELDLVSRAVDHLSLAHGALGLDAEDDVAEDRAPREQAGLLEHHGAIGARLRDLAPVEREGSGGDRDEAVDRVEERRLAAARRADDREELAGPHREVDALDRGEEGVRALQPVLDDYALRGELRGAVVHRS